MMSINSQPITSTNSGKLLVYLLILICSSFVLVGLIPLIFTVFFLYMGNKSMDFSNIETAAKFKKIYFHIAAAIGVSITLINFITTTYQKDDYFIGACVIALSWGLSI